MKRVLIVGAGDVARRAAPWLVRRFRVYALVRRPDEAARWRALGVTPLRGDLDDRASLRRLAGLAQLVLHCAPPPADGTTDPRMRRVLAALAGRGSLAQGVVYISTTGVYGDCASAEVRETRTCRPATARAQRRYDAETTLRHWLRRRCRRGLPARVAILRAPGIYAADRLPLERLQRGDPALNAADDVYTNHIHADDLARLCALALFRVRGGRTFNATDASMLKMGDYFDLVADAHGLPRPPRLPRSELATRLSPLTLSFMNESRRLDNRRLAELRVRLRYPDVASGLRDAGTRPPRDADE